MQILEIEDNTIENLKHDNHKRCKNWVAIVKKDRQGYGGLSRKFLERASECYVVLNDTVQPGTLLEMAGDYYSGSGRKSEIRAYYQVLERTETELRVEKIKLEDVKNGEVKQEVNPLAAYSDEEIEAEWKRRQK